MKIRYFEDTDTLLIELKPGSVAETRDLDAQGRVLALTLEHATARAEVSSFSFDRIEPWFEFRELRNITAHTYARDKAHKVAAGAPALLAQAQGLLTAIESRNHE